MVKRIRWSTLAACLLALAALVVSCGRKTDPLTPDSPRPEAVKGLAAAARGEVAYLTWSVPANNIEGKALPSDDIAAYQVYRAEVVRDRKRLRYRQVAVIDMKSPGADRVRDGVVTWTDPDVHLGRTYSYRVRALSVRGGESPFSADVQVVPFLSLAPPEKVSASAGDGVVTLSWEPVTRRTDASPHEGFVGYNIYRGSEKGHQDRAPLNREPVRATTYRDADVVNGRNYTYIVRAVDSPAPPWMESLDSAEASAAPRDMTPPAPPTDLTVVPGIGRVFLTWKENREKDLAGYHVYRASRSGAEPERLTDRPINRTTYSDASVKQGMTYYYTVTAVDRSGNEGGRSREQKTYTESIR